MIDTLAIKQKVSMLDLLPELRKEHSDYRAACPLHHGENDNAFVVTLDGQHWNCYSGDCGSGDVYDFVMKQHNCNFIRAHEILGGDNTPIPPAELQVIAAEREARRRCNSSNVARPA